MRHVHTSIVARHLATRGNDKILRTPPPHTSSSEEILPCNTRRTLAKLRKMYHPSSKYTYIKATTKHIHHHYAPSVTLTHTTHIISSTAPTYAPHCHPWICGQMDGEAGWWTTSGKIEFYHPPLARVMGVGRQQQLKTFHMKKILEHFCPTSMDHDQFNDCAQFTTYICEENTHG